LVSLISPDQPALGGIFDRLQNLIRLRVRVLQILKGPKGLRDLKSFLEFNVVRLQYPFVKDKALRRFAAEAGRYGQMNFWRQEIRQLMKSSGGLV